jgi:hypothetical protein
MEGNFTSKMPKSDVIEAWKSHATLKRQAGGDSVFDNIIEEIASCLDPLPEVIDVPYTTRIYFAQKIK